MKNIHFFENALVAITTSSFQDADLTSKLCDMLKDLYEQESLLVSYLNKEKQEVRKLLSETSVSYLLESSKKISVNGEGGALMFSDTNGKLFLLRYEWRRFYSHMFHKVVQSGKVMHNEISLQFDTSFILSDSKRTRFVSFCNTLASLFDVDYLKVFSIKNDKRGRGGRHDLKDGIQDIYWLNIFGRPFVEMIGKNVLLSSPGWQVTVIRDGVISIQSCDKFCDHSDSSNSATLDTIRAHIGEAYFVKENMPTEGDSGVGNFFDLLKTLWKTAKAVNDPRAKATTCPRYDFTRMILTSNKHRSEGG